MYLFSWLAIPMEFNLSLKNSLGNEVFLLSEEFLLLSQILHCKEELGIIIMSSQCIDPMAKCTLQHNVKAQDRLIPVNLEGIIIS